MGVNIPWSFEELLRLGVQPEVLQQAGYQGFDRVGTPSGVSRPAVPSSTMRVPYPVDPRSLPMRPTAPVPAIRPSMLPQGVMERGFTLGAQSGLEQPANFRTVQAPLSIDYKPITRQIGYNPTMLPPPSAPIEEAIIAKTPLRTQLTNVLKKINPKAALKGGALGGIAGSVGNMFLTPSGTEQFGEDSTLSDVATGIGSLAGGAIGSVYGSAGAAAGASLPMLVQGLAARLGYGGPSATEMRKADKRLEEAWNKNHGKITSTNMPAIAPVANEAELRQQWVDKEQANASMGYTSRPASTLLDAELPTPVVQRPAIEPPKSIQQHLLAITNGNTTWDLDPLTQFKMATMNYMQDNTRYNTALKNQGDFDTKALDESSNPVFTKAKVNKYLAEADKATQEGLYQKAQAEGHSAHLVNEFLKAKNAAKETKNPALDASLNVWEKAVTPDQANKLAKEIALRFGVLLPKVDELS